MGAVREWLLRRLGARPGVLARLAGDGADGEDVVVGLLFEEAPFGGLVVDAEGRIVRANKALHELIDAEPLLAVGGDAALIFAPESRETAWADVLALLKGRPGAVRNVPVRVGAQAQPHREAPPPRAPPSAKAGSSRSSRTVITRPSSSVSSSSLMASSASPRVANSMKPFPFDLPV